jgi:rhamnosyltransferase
MLVNLAAARLATNSSAPMFDVPVDYFIDMVDYEFCLRLRERGLRVVVVRSSIISHRMGEPKRVQLPLLGEVFVPNYSPLRWYYYTRNLTHLEFKRNRNARLRTFLRRLLFLRTPIKDGLFSRNLGKTLPAALRGFIDGLRGRLGITFR